MPGEPNHPLETPAPGPLVSVVLQSLRGFLWGWMLAVGTPLAAQQAGAPSVRPVNHQVVDTLLRDVLAASFPELGATEILLYELRSQSDYFTAGLQYRTILGKGRRRGYLVFVNPRLFVDPPSREALRAVLAHELSHIVDYTRWSPPRLIGFGLRYLTHPQAEYERETDVHAMQRGYAEGLADYREWLYRHVSAKVGAKKRMFYLTPEEIRAWRSQQGR